MNVADLLAQHGIKLSAYTPGQYAVTCPRCSARRSRAHQNTKCLGVKIDEKGACWRCNHCNWSGPEKGNGGNGKAEAIEATYDYVENGEFRFQKVRYPKGREPRFLLRTRDANGGWKWGAKEVSKPLYRIDEIAEAVANGHTILIAEGEKDVDNLWRIGLPATCNFDGAAEPGQKPKWKPAYSETLRGADIAILNDNDAPGYAHADAVARMSVGICERVRRLDLAPHWPDIPKGGDVSDWLALGHTREQLDALIAAAPDYASRDETPPQQEIYGPWHYHDEQPSPPTRWLIKKLLPETGSGLISGQWGTYKTTTALDLCVSVMGGLPFAGRFVVKRRGGVVYFAPEGAGGLKSRLDAIAKERGVTGILPFAWRPNCPPLVAPCALDDLVRLFDQASRDLKARHGVDTVLALVDTIVAAAGYTKAGDDNDTAAAQVIMSRLSELSKRSGALALGVDHFGKLIETGTRGSSVKEGHADVVLATLGERQVNGTITNTRLAIRKLRDGPSGLEIPFTPRDMVIGTDADGEREMRKVLDWSEPEEAAAAADSWPPSLQLLRRILMTTIADVSKEVTPFADGPTVRAVDRELIRAEFCKQYPADGDTKQKAATRRQAFGRAVKLAQSRSLIMVREINDTQLVWFASKEEEPNG